MSLPAVENPATIAAPPLMRRRVAVSLAAAFGIALLAGGVALHHAGSRSVPVGGEGWQQPVDTLGELARHLEQNPSDARARAIYARMQSERGDYSAAASAYEQAVAVRSRVALDPQVWCEYAEAVAMANRGRLRGKPESLIARALVLNPRHPRALEMAGSAAVEQERFGEALQHWEQLLELLPVDSAQHRELLSAIERTRMRSGRS